MSLCDSDMMNQVESMTEFPVLEKKLDSIGLLLKKIVYTGGTNDLNTRQYKAMAHMNLINLYQAKSQDIQEFRYQYMTMKKVCDEL